MMTTQSITSGQSKQIVRFGSDAIEKVLQEPDSGFCKEGAQRVIERGDEFALVIKNAARSAFQNLSISDRFKNEEVQSNYGYLSGYSEPVKVSDQIDILRSHWPNLNPDSALRYARETYPTLRLPDWVEGPFAIIRPGFFSDEYGEELKEMLKSLAKDRGGKFCNYREGLLGPEYLRQSKRTLSKLRALMEQQSGSDILILPAQFGIRHRGRSIRRAREVFLAGEYGTGAKDTGTMILTNSIRLQDYDDLWIDCAGDEFSPGADGEFRSAPCFRFSDGGIRFDACGVDYAGGDYGSVSAFLPQLVLNPLNARTF